MPMRVERVMLVFDDADVALLHEAAHLFSEADFGKVALFAKHFEGGAFGKRIERLRLVARGAGHVGVLCSDDAFDFRFGDKDLVAGTHRDDAENARQYKQRSDENVLLTVAAADASCYGDECQHPENSKQSPHLSLERKRVVCLEEPCQKWVLFAVFVYFIAGHGLRVLQVVQDVVVARIEAKRRFVIVNGEAELAASEVGVAQIVIKIGIFDSVVGAGAPFVDGAFKVAFVVRLFAGRNPCASWSARDRKRHR